MFKKLLFAAGVLVVLTYAQDGGEVVETTITENTEVPATETAENVETTETVETTTETTETVTEVTEETTTEEAVVVVEETANVENEEGLTVSGSISGNGSASGTIDVTDLDINGASHIIVPTAALVALAALLQ